MKAMSTATVVTGGVALLERAMGYTLGSLLLVTPETMSCATPCTAWDLRALLLHMNDSLRTLHEAIAVGHVDFRAVDFRAVDFRAVDFRAVDFQAIELQAIELQATDDPGADDGDPAVDPVASLRNRACRMIGAWTNAGGGGDISIAGKALSAGIVAAAGAVEVAVHGWDVARACGQHNPLPPALAGELLDLCRLLVRDADRPARFAARIDLAPDRGSPSDQLLAFLGRRPD
jgi:uncharacterized protein (TIGR03086 family)